MANEIGTASNLEDLVTKIITFLTTNADLITAGQQWQVLRQRRDNLAALTTNLLDAGAAAVRRSIHTCRYEPRSLNIDSPTSTNVAFYATNFSAGVSYTQLQLRTTRAVATVRLKAPEASIYFSQMPKTFRLQYSDDGSAWTTALTVTNTIAFTADEIRDFAVPGTPGSHVYWRFLWDAVQTGASAIAWQSLLLLEADGTVANHFGSEVLFKSTGTGGTDEIFTGIRSEYDSAAGWYNLFLNGYTGYDVNEQSFFKQPGALNRFGTAFPKATPMVPCWNSSMPYWLVANGRSFRFAVKVNTSYEGGYLGFILPYATPGQYPYPLAVGGSLVPQTGSRSGEWAYSYANYRHGVYPGPGGSGFASDTENPEGTLYLRNPEGDWKYYINRPNSGVGSDSVNSPTMNISPPFSRTANVGPRGVWPHNMNNLWTSGRLPYRECLGGGHILQPCVMMQGWPTTAVYGELEGTFVISGFGNSAEDTTSLGGTNYVIFQNAYRNTAHEYWALSLN